jgi:hypothetical protein
VLINFTEDDNVYDKDSNRLCPSQCQPIPTANIPKILLTYIEKNLSIEKFKDYAVSCSLTLSMIGSPNKHHAHGVGALTLTLPSLLKTVAKRVSYECNESLTHSNVLNKSNFSKVGNKIQRRKVEGVVIWVGTSSNMKLMVDQTATFSHTDIHGQHAVVSWAATDSLYSCSDASTECKGNLGVYKYLPATNMKYMPPGWRCAQRRPLRALSHVLALFNPTYVVMLDDDTFFNFPLLMRQYGRFMFEQMRSQPLYLGEFQGRTGPAGHLSVSGIFAGGSGYILGGGLLARLQRKEVPSFGHEVWPGGAIATAGAGAGAAPVLSAGSSSARSKAGKEKEKETEVAVLERSADEFRSAQQIKYLSVLTEGIEEAAAACPRSTLPDPESGHLSQPPGHFRTVHGHGVGVGLGEGASHHYADGTTNNNSCVLSLVRRHRHHQHQQHQQHQQHHPSSTKNFYQAVPIAVRLVEFCTRLMASEHTCHHRYVCSL